MTLTNLNEFDAEPNLKECEETPKTLYNTVMENANYKWRVSRTGKRHKVPFWLWWRCTCKECDLPFWAVLKKANVCPECQELKTKETENDNDLG